VLTVQTPPEIAAAYGIAPQQGTPAGTLDWSAWLEGFAPWAGETRQSPARSSDASGTTGHPKGVRRAPPTPEQSDASMRSLLTIFGLTTRPPDQIVSVMVGPMYHSAPNAYGSVCARIGANLHLEARFEPEALLRMIQDYKVTHLPPWCRSCSTGCSNCRRTCAKNTTCRRWSSSSTPPHRAHRR